MLGNLKTDNCGRTCRTVIFIPTNKEMCHVVEIPFGQRLNSTVPEQREMCRTVFQRQQGINTDNITGKTMCVIIK